MASFTFRFLAGLAFSVIYLLRGFGIVAGAHVYPGQVGVGGQFRGEVPVPHRAGVEAEIPQVVVARRRRTVDVVRDDVFVLRVRSADPAGEGERKQRGKQGSRLKHAGFVRAGSARPDAPAAELNPWTRRVPLSSHPSQPAAVRKAG